MTIQITPPDPSRKKIDFTKYRQRTFWIRSKRLSPLQWGLMVLAVLLALGVHYTLKRLAGRTAPVPPKNVLLITLHATRQDRLGCYGYRRIETSRIDRLAEEGALFLNAFSTAPLTLPSHASIMTGRYPASHGIRLNGVMTLPEEALTVAEILGDRGYFTGAVINSFALHSVFGLNQGFSVYDDRLPRSPEGSRLPFRSAVDGTEAMKSLLSNRGEKPFFLWMHFAEPCMKYDLPAPFAEAYAERPYDGEIAYMDRAVEEIVQFLMQENLLKETLIILTADHGEGLGDHGETSHGLFIYNTTIRVPLIVHHPLSIREGQRISHHAALVDMVPTMLEALDIPVPQDVEGRSLLPLVNGQAPGEAGRDIPIENQAPMKQYGWSPQAGIIRGHWKYILAPDPELYHLAEDPDEKSNLFSSRREEAESLHALLQTRLEAFREKALPDEGGEAAGTVSPDRGKDPKTMLPVKKQLDQAAVRLESGDPGSAVETLREVTAVDPANMTALTLLGIALLQAEEPEKAADVLEAAVTLDPVLGDAHFHAGLAYERLGDTIAALSHFQHVDHFNIHYIRALNRMGRIFAGIGDMERAIETWQQALAVDADDSMIRFNLGKGYFSQGKFSHAEAEYRKVLEQDPESWEILLELGKIYLLTGEKEEAAKIFRKVLSLNPRSRRAEELLKRTEVNW